MICRLFGFSAMLGKTKAPVLVTCKPIKDGQPEAIEKANMLLTDIRQVPLISNYYVKLRNIDHYLGEKLMPINEAVVEAIKVTLNYYAYSSKKPA